jgi:threonylcarbamoyladenosine tRNA methylthiotransferase CDKAL1
MDIEDLKPPDLTRGPRCDDEVVPKHKRNARFKPRTECNAPSFLPETKRVYVRTFGCAHNASDSEYMAGVLAAEGFDVSVNHGDAASADAWVINSCTVKDPSQAAFVKEARQAMAEGKGVVVAGCVPQGDRGLVKRKPGKAPPLLDGVSSIGVKQLGRVGEAVAASLRGEVFHALGQGPLPSLELPKQRKEALVEIVPLSTGCLGACTYCKTRHARGKLGSYAPEAIEKRISQALDEGVAEVWLSSEDTGAYGIDLQTSLSALLLRLIPVLEKRPFASLRVGMTNPPYVLDQLDTLAEVMEHPQIYAFLHVPVQSGSNEVLGVTRMNREYTVQDFEKVVNRLQDRVEGGVTIMTDIICGFPGETEEDFEETYQLVERHSFHLMNISQFYSRPGTPAAKMKRVPTKAVKARSRRLTQLAATFKPYGALVGVVEACASCGEVADGGRRLVAHTKRYVKVLVPFDERLVGARFDVKITAAHRWHIDGQVVRVTLAADASSRPALRDALAALRRRGVDVSAERVPVSRRAAALAVLPLAVGMVVFYLSLLLA